MSRHDGDLQAAQEAERALVELLSRQLPGPAGSASRNEAMARFLSAGEGWEEAMALLGGAFAGEGPAATGLTPGKEG